MGFVQPIGPETQTVWAKIPDSTDILLTHGPPHGICDASRHQDEDTRQIFFINAGCPHLTETVLNRVKPLVHQFGHIHEAYGHVFQGSTLFMCLVDSVNYKKTNGSRFYKLGS
jgi:Icc-related predicted phosphoesterase